MDTAIAFLIFLLVILAFVVNIRSLLNEKIWKAQDQRRCGISGHRHHQLLLPEVNP